MLKVRDCARIERRRGSKLAPSWLLLILLALLCPHQRALAEKQDEYKVKAAFVYNFTNFVEWPVRADDEALKICFDQVADIYPVAQQNLRGKQSDGLPIQVLGKALTDSIGECHVLYVADHENWLHRRLAQIDDKPILSISDNTDFIRRGGTIRLFLSTNVIRFEISAENAARNGLRISSRLLKLSRGN